MAFSVEGRNKNIIRGDDFFAIDNSVVAAAHELKTPLVLLRQLSLQLAETDDEALRNKIICRMKLASERSLRMVDNLTRAARLDDAMFAMEPVNVRSVIDEVLDELSPLSQVMHQEFINRGGRRPLVAVGHRELIRSLLTGLVDNALQYNGAKKTIEISSRINRGSAEIAVRDHGPVIEKADFRKLSQSIGRRSMPISSRPLSSGLGLMIAGQFANAMNGEFAARRHAAGGMTFSVRLPISAQLSFLEL